MDSRFNSQVPKCLITGATLLKIWKTYFDDSQCHLVLFHVNASGQETVVSQLYVMRLCAFMLIHVSFHPPLLPFSDSLYSLVSFHLI